MQAVVQGDTPFASELVRILRGRGCSVRTVVGGDAVLASVGNDVDLVVLDAVSGGAEAAGVCARVRRASRGADVVVLALLHRRAPDIAGALVDAGVDDVICVDEGAFVAVRVAMAERVVADRTARRRAEAALRSSEERYRVIARATSEAIWDWNVLTNALTWNAGMETLFGYREADVGPDLDWWSSSVHPDDRARVVASLDGAMEGNDRVWSAEYRYRRADGSYADVLDRGAILRDASGRPYRAIGTMVDITERKRMEARILVADRMASLGTMAAGVAHEINNPLSYVLANLRFVREKIEAVLGAAGLAAANEDALRRAVVALDESADGAERVRQIVRDLKAFSRADESQRGAVSVRAVVEAAVRIAENEIRHRARLVTAFGDVPMVRANEARLVQVFLNLLVNAAQSIPEGRVADNEIRVVTGVDASGRVSVEIRDTGSGIPEALLGQVFDPFFTTKQVGEGTGLGLAICHGIVTSLGGEIRVESREGHGSTFLVLLPAHDARPEAEPAPPERPPVPRRARVLVVDDEPFIVSAIQRTLEEQHDVVAVTNARDALAKIESEGPFDLVLCDLMMPEMTGMDLYEHLLRSDPQHAAKVVFLTGGAFTARARNLLANVENRRIEKPFDADALLAFVQDALR